MDLLIYGYRASLYKWQFKNLCPCFYWQNVQPELYYVGTLPLNKYTTVVVHNKDPSYDVGWPHLNGDISVNIQDI